jgi:hypothetical protein
MSRVEIDRQRVAYEAALGLVGRLPAQSQQPVAPFAGLPNPIPALPPVPSPVQPPAQAPLVSGAQPTAPSGVQVIVADAPPPESQVQSGQDQAVDEPSFGQKVADGLRRLWHWIVVGFFVVAGATALSGGLYLWFTRPRTKVETLKEAFADIDKVDGAYEAEIETS